MATLIIVDNDVTVKSNQNSKQYIILSWWLSSPWKGLWFSFKKILQSKSFSLFIKFYNLKTKTNPRQIYDKSIVFKNQISKL